MGLILVFASLISSSCNAYSNNSMKASSEAQYLNTKIRAYNNIIQELKRVDSTQVNLVFHTSKYFPSDLRKTYTNQVINSSKL